MDIRNSLPITSRFSGGDYLTNEKCRSSWIYARRFASVDSGVDFAVGRIREEEADEPFGWTTIVSRVSFAGVAGCRLDIPGLGPTGKLQGANIPVGR
jgi:hypothetical protein